MNEKLWWYIARSTGIVAWALIATAVIWGLLLTTKLLDGRPAPKWLLDLHRFLGALAVAFTAVHLGGLVADTYTAFGPADLLVPFASSWKPLPVALGVVAIYLLIAVEVSSLAMRRIPRRWWRGIHLTSFGSFWLATIHGIAAGTDHSNRVLMFAYIATAGVVIFLTVFRVLADRHRRAPDFVPGPVVRHQGRGAGNIEPLCGPPAAPLQGPRSIALDQKSLDGAVDRGVVAQRAVGLQQVGAFEHVQDVVVGPGDGDHTDTMGTESGEEVAEPVNGGDVDGTDAFAVHDEPPFLAGVVGKGLFDPFGEALDVDEEQRCVETEHQQPVRGERCGELLEVDPTVEPGSGAQHGVVRTRDTRQHNGEGQANSEKHAGQDTGHDHAQRRDDRQRALNPAHPPQVPHAGQVDDGKGRGDDHRRERAAWDLAQRRAQAHQGDNDETRRHDRYQLRAGPQRCGHRSATGAGGDRETLE